MARQLPVPTSYPHHTLPASRFFTHFVFELFPFPVRALHSSLPYQFRELFLQLGSEGHVQLEVLLFRFVRIEGNSYDSATCVRTGTLAFRNMAPGGGHCGAGVSWRQVLPWGKVLMRRRDGGPARPRAAKTFGPFFSPD